MDRKEDNIMIQPKEYIQSQAEKWKDIRLSGASLCLIQEDEESKYSRPLNSTQKSWFDEKKNTIYIKLSSVRSEAELDRLIIVEFLSHYGLQAFMSEAGLNSLGRSVFGVMPKEEKVKLLGKMLGDVSGAESEMAAGRMYINNVAKNADKKDYKNAVSQEWYNLVNLHIRRYMRPVCDITALPRSQFAQALSQGLRNFMLKKSNEVTMLRYDTSSESVKDIILNWAKRESEGLPMDRDRVIKLGKTPDILLRYSARLNQDALLELPASAFYGRRDLDREKRFVRVGEDQIKRDKHPFSLLEVRNIKTELEKPLAIFYSKNNHSTLVMLGIQSGNDRHFCVPITAKEIFYSKELGRRTSPHSGRWVNNIDSVYPKDDISYLFILSQKEKVRYLSDEFREKWLIPATERIDSMFKEKSKINGIPLPPDAECKKILSAYPVYQTNREDVFEGSFKRLLNATELKEPSGFLRLYAEYRVALESATKVVKEFENQKESAQKNAAPKESREERRARLRERSEKNTRRWSNNITTKNLEPKIKR